MEASMTRFLAVPPLLALMLPWALGLAVLLWTGVSGSALGAPVCAVMAALGLQLQHCARVRRDAEARRLPVRPG
jgi:hypothetical protein